MIKAKRYRTREIASIEVYGHIGIVSAKLENLSLTGAFLEIAKGSYVPQKGDLLNLTVNLSSVRKSHNLAAEVVWSRGMGIGICFINKGEVLERMMAKADGF